MRRAFSFDGKQRLKAKGEEVRPDLFFLEKSGFGRFYPPESKLRRLIKLELSSRPPPRRWTSA
jgi:hypothetical protein